MVNESQLWVIKWNSGFKDDLELSLDGNGLLELCGEQ